MKKQKVPRLKTDKEVEELLAQVLSGFNFSQFTPTRFEFEKESAQLNMAYPNPC